jgi:hypothetical protein
MPDVDGPVVDGRKAVHGGSCPLRERERVYPGRAHFPAHAEEGASCERGPEKGDRYEHGLHRVEQELGVRSLPENSLNICSLRVFQSRSIYREYEKAGIFRQRFEM